MRNTVFCVKRGVLRGWFVNIFLSLKMVNAIFIISLETSAKSFYAMDSLFYRYEKIRIVAYIIVVSQYHIDGIFLSLPINFSEYC